MILSLTVRRSSYSGMLVIRYCLPRSCASQRQRSMLARIIAILSPSFAGVSAGASASTPQNRRVRIEMVIASWFRLFAALPTIEPVWQPALRESALFRGPTSSRSADSSLTCRSLAASGAGLALARAATHEIDSEAERGTGDRRGNQRRGHRQHAQRIGAAAGWAKRAHRPLYAAKRPREALAAPGPTLDDAQQNEQVPGEFALLRSRSARGRAATRTRIATARCPRPARTRSPP